MWYIQSGLLRYALFEKTDPDLRESEKLDPNLHQSQNSGALGDRNGTVVADSHHFDEEQDQIRIKEKSRILFALNSPISNPVIKYIRRANKT